MFIGAINYANTEKALEELYRWSGTAEKAAEFLIISEGGDVGCAFAIADQMHRLQRDGLNITTHAMGWVASAANLIMQAGDTRVMDKNAILMIHHSYRTLSQKTTASIAQASADRSGMFDQKMFEVITERTNYDAKELIARIGGTEYVVNSNQALLDGLADRIA